MQSTSTRKTKASKKSQKTNLMHPTSKPKAIGIDSELASSNLDSDQNDFSGCLDTSGNKDLSNLLEQCMKKDLKDPRFWDNQFEKWKKDPINN